MMAHGMQSAQPLSSMNEGFNTPTTGFQQSRNGTGSLWKEQLCISKQNGKPKKCFVTLISKYLDS